MTSETMTTIPLAELLAKYTPGSSTHKDWSWDDEEAEILGRTCICCGQPGHYQQQLESHLSEHGLTQGVCLGDDGRVWDGHHRIVAARRLGIDVIPVESGEEAGQRWLRDHGPVDWLCRKFGDRSPWEREWRERAARGDYGPHERAKVQGQDD